MFKNMKKKKKILALLVAIAMVLVPVAAYGSQYDTYEPYEEAYEADYTVPTPGLEGGYEAISGMSGGYQGFMPFTSVIVTDQPGFEAALNNSSISLIDIQANVVLNSSFTIQPGRNLTITGTAGNVITASNGGFVVPSDRNLVLENITIQGTGGTGVIVNGGTFTMNSGEIREFPLRGVLVTHGGEFIMEGGSIFGNLAPGPGGYGGAGVLVDGGPAPNNPSFLMNGGRISGNTSGSHGGGVSVVRGAASFTMTGGVIGGEGAENSNASFDGATGGGVHVAYPYVSFNMHGGYITNNNANRGGGVNVTNSATFTMHSGTINLNTARYGGGGVHTGGNSVFIMHNGAISGNSADAPLGRPQGGGVFAGGALFDMRGGTISNNTAHEGGGVFHIRNAFDMRGGSISGNTATTSDPTQNSGGGGVMIAWDPTNRTFTMHGGTITDNHAPNSSGGGVNIYGPSATFNMIGGYITNNSAGAYGGAISVRIPNVVIDISGGTISGNRATRNGGAIGLLVPNVPLTIRGSVNINNNTAANGGGIGFRLDNDRPVSEFEAFLSNTNIARTVVFERNIATAGSRPNQELHTNKTPSPIDPIYVTQGYGTGAFTNNYIHTPFSDLKWLQVTKLWYGDEEYLDERPNSVRVELLSNGNSMNPQRIITITAANDWVGFFDNLLTGPTYTIRELDVPVNYTSDDAEARVRPPALETSNVWTISFTNTRYEDDIRLPAPINFQVTKEWVGDGNHLDRRPEFITVELRRPGQVVPVATQQIRPDANGVWTHTWIGLASRDTIDAPLIMYYVVERNVPTGYRPRVEIARNAETGHFTATITNTFTPGDDPPPQEDRRRTGIRRGPLTGDLASVAPLFAGLLFASSAVLGGTSLRKKLKDMF